MYNETHRHTEEFMTNHLVGKSLKSCSLTDPRQNAVIYYTADVFCSLKVLLTCKNCIKKILSRLVARNVEILCDVPRTALGDLLRMILH